MKRFFDSRLALRLSLVAVLVLMGHIARPSNRIVTFCRPGWTITPTPATT